MRLFSIILLSILVLLSGCSKPFWKKSSKQTAAEPKSTVKQKTVATDLKKAPSPSEIQSVLSGRVKSVNDKARFVIITFPVGRMPQVGQIMWVYREGQRVGRVKITGPQLDLNIAADIIEGDAAQEDEVRPE
jgi:hypothetical protein